MSSETITIDKQKEDERIAKFFDSANLPDAPADILLQDMVAFVLTHAKNMRELKTNLAASTAPAADWETWDPERDAVQALLAPHEPVKAAHLIRTDSPQLDKVLKALAVLCAEADTLCKEAERRLFIPVAMFGNVAFLEGSVEEEDAPEVSLTEEDEGAGRGGLAIRGSRTGKPELEMGRFIPVMQNLSNFAARCSAVVRNMVNQLAFLYHKRRKLYVDTFNAVQLPSMFCALGRVLRVVHTLDVLVVDNPRIGLAWNAFKLMMKYVRADPSAFSADAEQLHTFESMLVQLDRRLVNANLFEMCLDQTFGVPDETGKVPLAQVAGNNVLCKQFTDFLSSSYHMHADDLRTESGEAFPREQLVELFCVYALYRRLFRSTVAPDKKLFKQLWAIQKKVPLVPLFGTAVFTIPEFLLSFAPLDNPKGLDPPAGSLVKAQKDFLSTLDDNFPRQVNALFLKLCVWMVRVDAEYGVAPSRLGALLNSRSKLTLNGLVLANAIHNLVLTFLHLHSRLRVKFKKTTIRPLSVCLEMLQSLRATYHRCAHTIGLNLSHMMGQTAAVLRATFVPIQRTLQAKAKKGNLREGLKDIAAAADLGIRQLRHAPTPERLIVVRLALSIAQLRSMLNQKKVDEIRYQLWKLELLANCQKELQKRCRCDFMFWYTYPLVPAFLADIMQEPQQVGRLQPLLSALQDPAYLLAKAVHMEDQTALLTSYKKELLSLVEEHVVHPVAREVEKDLRLHIHSVVLRQETIRRQQVREFSDLGRFLTLKPLHVFEFVVAVADRVAHYLDRTFYNHTTITLHNWRVYQEMGNLAREKYGLNLTEVHLPGHDHYSEALDVLEIMRNIHIFVAKFAYNMNTQVFQERAFDQKHLNLLTIDHIASSIRTHGTGIMNTTVNFTYQFLCRKFLVFSEFLFDDHIKSRLIQEVRFFKNERLSLDNKYPFERAEKFVKAIRKLGVTEDGQTFLDKFRQLITEIGNAMGYVRMVRSGGLQACSEAIKFVPNLHRIPNFLDIASSVSAYRSPQEKIDFRDVTHSSEPLNEHSHQHERYIALVDPRERRMENPREEEEEEQEEEAVETRPLGQETLDSARLLDECLRNLSESFAEGTDYFKVLVDVFSPVVRDRAYEHLVHFFMILPALTLNFVDKSLVKKDQLSRKGGRNEAGWTDDGFPLGVAYLLKLLGQDQQFDSLHWFDSLRHFLNEQLVDLKRRRITGPKSEDIRSSAIRKLHSKMREYELLFFGLSGARVFFRETIKKPAEATPEEAPQTDAAPVSETATAAGIPAAPTMGAIPAAPSMAALGTVPAAPVLDISIPTAPALDSDVGGITW